jgi:uncharacterized lipoprotein YddW (UPF0748 family)
MVCTWIIFANPAKTLDMTLVMARWHGKKFQALTGIDPTSINQNNRSLWWLWTEFRTQQVSQFVNLVSTEMDRIKPEIVISAAVFPYERVQRISRMQQNWEDWVSRGDIDLLVPMTYEQDTTRFLQQRVQPALSGVARSPVLFLPGVNDSRTRRY